VASSCITVDIEVPIEKLDVCAEKAKELIVLLERVKQLLEEIGFVAERKESV
jgi:hypothetical protein